MYERPAGIESCRIWVDGCFDFAHHGMFSKSQLEISKTQASSLRYLISLSSHQTNH